MAISKFTTVYAGHIDFPDHGQDATPANERRFSNDELAGVFEKTEAIAKTMDDLGYDMMWMAEHHFQHEGYECIPNILMLAVHLCHITKNIKTRCASPRISPPPTSSPRAAPCSASGAATTPARSRPSARR